MEPTLYAPTPGTAQPGNLYADLQSRTLWLGVDAAVDPNQAVLISDIVALQSQIVAGDNADKQYTLDALDGLLPSPRNIAYSKINHKHTSLDITDFNAAVTSVATGIPALQYVRGMIMLWYGQPGQVGVDKLAGWALCDGTTYTIDGVQVKTPNLMDRFVIGASPTRAVNSLNPLSSFLLDVQGAHSHTTVTGTHALTANEMPYHAHTFADTSPITGTITAAGAHAHGGVLRDAGTRIEGGSWAAHGGAGGATDSAGNHTHPFNLNTSISGTTNYQGANWGHNHTISQDGAHQHTVTSAQIRDAIASYALCYIMKL
jgi:hypothetical protein